MFSGAVVDCDCDGPEPIPCLALLFDIAGKERVLQDIVQGVQITRARRLHRQKLVESRLGIHLAATCGVVLQGVQARGRCHMH